MINLVMYMIEPRALSTPKHFAETAIRFAKTAE